jgi:hypothetical protein
MSETEIPVLGPVTVTFDPAAAAETAMVLQHILHNVPENPREDQAMRAHNLGLAAMAVSGGLIKAMHDAGLSDDVIARASGQLYRAPQEEGAQMELTEAESVNPAGENAVEADLVGPHPLDPPDVDPATLPTADVVDFPTPGGPPDAA